MSINTGTDISGLSANTQYTFSLYPINANGQQSTTVTQVQFTTLPKITTATVATATSYNQLSLTLTGSYSTVNVEYNTDGGTSYTTFVTTSNTTIAVTSLSENTRYYFKLTPYNSASVAGTVAYVTDAAATTLGRIATFTAPSVSKTSITLNWTGIYTSAIIYYDTVEGSETNSTPISTASTSTGTTQSIDITGLTSDTTYYFKIKPYNINSLVGTTATVSTTTASDKYSLTELSSASSVSYYYPLDGNKYNYNTNGTATTTEFTLGGDTTNENIVFKTTPGDTLSTKRTYSYYLINGAYATLSSTLTITNATGFSISLWCRINSSQFAGNYAIFNFKNNDNNYTIYLLSGGTAIKLVSSSHYGVNYSFSKDQWYHIVVTITNNSNSSNNTLKIYVNNTNITGTNGITSFPLNFSSTNAYTLRLNDNSTTYDGINGYYSNVLVAKYVLSTNDISHLYTNYK